MLKMPKNDSEFMASAQNFMKVHPEFAGCEVDYFSFSNSLIKLSDIGSFFYSDSCLTYPNRILDEDYYYLAAYLNNGLDKLNFFALTSHVGKYSDSYFISFEKVDRDFLDRSIKAPEKFKNEIIELILNSLKLFYDDL